MQLLVQLNRIEMLKRLEEKQCDIVVGLAYYSSRAALSLDVEQIKNLDFQGKIYVLVNRLYEQKEIEGLKAVLKQLASTSIAGIIFQDFAVMSISKMNQYPFELIYNSDTLNTSHGSINTLGKLGVNGCMLANQLHEDEVKSICENSEVDLFIQIHGVQYISHSKRKLLSNYFDFIQIEHKTSKEASILMKVNDMDVYSHIFEDDFGTHIFTTNELCLKDYIQELKVKYGYIETLYLEDDYILALIDFYRSNHNYAYLQNTYPTHQYDTGFFEDGTVYKLEDVRKRDANEKR